MNTAIIYMSKHGTTVKVANLIKEKINGQNIDLINLKKDKAPDIAQYEKIIIGGSIHVGMIQKKIRKFCENNKDLLLTKKLALFIICMEKGEKREKQFTDAFPEELREHSICNGLLGGEFVLENMNFFEKAIVKKIAGVTSSTSALNTKALDDFIKKITE
ncbi:MAG: flavodoxin [Calditrichia bacterium]|nr:flavodoxin [Calditrichia bacterium]